MVKEKAQYAPPASQVDLEERLANGNKSFRELSTSDTYEGPKDDNPEGRDFRVEGNDVTQYIGTSAEYATYANETEAPLGAADESENPEAQVFREFAESPIPATLRVEGNVEYEGEMESKEAAAQASEDARADVNETPDEEPSTTQSSTSQSGS